MKKAIQKAYNAGWKPKAPYLENLNPNILVGEILASMNEAEIREDALFWQALGKAMGWDKHNEEYFENRKYDYWQLTWHRFIDHLAEGKDAESFFNDLLK